MIDESEVEDIVKCSELLSRLVCSGALYQNERVSLSEKWDLAQVSPRKPSHPFQAILWVKLKSEIVFCDQCDEPRSFAPADLIEIGGCSAFSMKCATCQQIIFFAFRCGLLNGRELKLQLVGRSPMYKPTAKAPFPRSIRNVIKDALLAVAQTDLSAGFYHLRTAIELSMKEEVEIDVDEKIEGGELVESYKAKMGDLIPSNAPSFKTIYSDLSGFLHNRKGSAEDFKRIFGQIELHFKAIELNKELASHAQKK